VNWKRGMPSHMRSTKLDRRRCGSLRRAMTAEDAFHVADEVALRGRVRSDSRRSISRAGASGPLPTNTP